MLQLRGWHLLQSCKPVRRKRALNQRLDLFKSTWILRGIHNDKQPQSKAAPTVAIVGSGPAGFYTAQKLMRELHGVTIDMYEQLPVPFGLVRFGVAPDHPEVKNCQDTFHDVASSPNYTFIGNIHLGHDLPLRTLAQNYDAIVFAYGASKDRKLGLKGEDNNRHIYSARAFVGWYNGLPEYRDLNPDIESGETAVIVGQGNVALDVARTLLSKIEHLKNTDITDYALQALTKSKIKHVHIVGRRGPMQAAFTIKEIRELVQMEDVQFKPVPDDLFPVDDLSKLPRPKRRIMELLKKASNTPVNSNATKSWSLDFLLAPAALNWSETDPSKLASITFTRTRLADPASPDSKVTPTSETHTIKASTLFRSIGYKAEAIPGINELGATFDEHKGIIQHDGVGRVDQHDSSSNSKTKLYCAGWVKRGPTGVIASTMTDAFETAEAIVSDWKQGGLSTAPSNRGGWKAVRSDAAKQGLSLNPVHWDGWEAIDRAEKEEGSKKGKPREKMGSVQQMLEASNSSSQ